MIINCYILDRQTHEVKQVFRCADWTIERDYLSNPSSTFTPLTKFEAQQGDYLIAKNEDHLLTEGYVLDTNNEQEVVNPLYFGVINSFDNGTIITYELIDLLDFTFPATYKSGTNVGQHLYNLINRYLTSQPDQKVKPDLIDVETVDQSSHINWVYSPEDPPTETNMISYFQNAFEKYGVIWAVKNIVLSSMDINSYKINTTIKQPTKTFSLKNNTGFLTNWKVYVAPVDYGFENKLLIVDKSSTNMENPIILATYYIEMNGNLTQLINGNVYQPCKQKVVFFDTTAENNPTYLELAQQNLSRTSYSHEIDVDLLLDNPLVDVNSLELGMQANLVYDGSFYNSILTGYSLSADALYMTLHFGNIRSSLKKYI